MAIGRRGEHWAVFVYDPAVKYKRYVGQFATRSLAQEAERGAKREFGARWTPTDDELGWRERLGQESRAACDAAIDAGEQLVYFIQGAEGGPIKIGIAVDPADRLQQLQLQSPARFVIRHVVIGGAARERELHIEFGMHRLWGEWFAPVSKLLRLCRARPMPKDWLGVDVVERLKAERDGWQARAIAAEELIGEAHALLGRVDAIQRRLRRVA